MRKSKLRRKLKTLAGKSDEAKLLLEKFFKPIMDRYWMNEEAGETIGDVVETLWSTDSRMIKCFFASENFTMPGRLPRYNIRLNDSREVKKGWHVFVRVTKDSYDVEVCVSRFYLSQDSREFIMTRKQFAGIACKLQSLDKR